jgi:hypothetical protein
MRFMTLVRSDVSQGPPPQALEAAMGKWIEESFKNGTLVEAGGLNPAGAARVRLSRGKVTVTDGPFAEAKEVIGGYAVLELASLEEAIEAGRYFMELHRLHWPGWEGESEVRQIFA